LENLSDLKFSLVVKDSGFDDPAYYDKMALELVMSGQRAGASISNFKDVTPPVPSTQPVHVPPPVPSPQPVHAPSPVKPLQSQPQPTPPQTRNIESDMQSSPQTLKQPMPKETPEKKKSPQAKRKAAARPRTIIDAAPTTERENLRDSSELPATPSTPVEKPHPTLHESKPVVDDPPTIPSEPTPLAHSEPTPAVHTGSIKNITIEIPDFQHTTPTTITPATPVPASPDSVQSISDSDLVPVKIPNMRSPYSVTDTDSVFSSAEMISSQNSTPSFTAVTDDTDFSPLTTPNLRTSTNTMSPKLTLHSEDSSLEANLNTINYGNNVSTSLISLEPSTETTLEPTSTTTELLNQNESTQEPTQEPTQILTHEPTPEPAQEQSQVPTQEPIPESTNLVFAQVSPPTEHVKESQEPITTKGEELSSEPELHDLVEPAHEPANVTLEDVAKENKRPFRPPTPTIGDFANMELPIEQPTPTKYLPPTLVPPHAAEIPFSKPTLPPLIEDLKRDVYAVLGNSDLVIREADALLTTIEKILSHGIRAGAVFLHAPLPLDQVSLSICYILNRILILLVSCGHSCALFPLIFLEPSLF
jgi:hypothetical protein